MQSGAIHDVISAIIYCLINAVDGCGDHATTKPVDVWSCMGPGPIQDRIYIGVAGWGGGGGSRIRYSIKNLVLIRDSVSEISP